MKGFFINAWQLNDYVNKGNIFRINKTYEYNCFSLLSAF